MAVDNIPQGYPIRLWSVLRMRSYGVNPRTHVRGVLCYGVTDSMTSPHLVKGSHDGVQGYTVKGLKARRIDNKGEYMFIILIMTGWSVIIVKGSKCL